MYYNQNMEFRRVACQQSVCLSYYMLCVRYTIF
jgi:hypothetical protein